MGKTKHQNGVYSQSKQTKYTHREHILSFSSCQYEQQNTDAIRLFAHPITEGRPHLETLSSVETGVDTGLTQLR